MASSSGTWRRRTTRAASSASAHSDGSPRSPVPPWRRALRGHRLQCELVRRRAGFARAEGFTDLYATAAPGNVPSWRNLLSEGFAIVALLTRYGSLLRYLLHRALDAPTAAGARGRRVVRSRGSSSAARAARLRPTGVAYRGGAGEGREIGFGPLPE